MFFMQIIEAFLVRTEPASSIVNPAHIHITSAPPDEERERVEDERGFRSDVGGVRDRRLGNEEHQRENAGHGKDDGGTAVGQDAQDGHPQ